MTKEMYKEAKKFKNQLKWMGIFCIVSAIGTTIGLSIKYQENSENGNEGIGTFIFVGICGITLLLAYLNLRKTIKKYDHLYPNGPKD